MLTTLSHVHHLDVDVAGIRRRRQRRDGPSAPGLHRRRKRRVDVRAGVHAAERDGELDQGGHRRIGLRPIHGDEPHGRDWKVAGPRRRRGRLRSREKPSG